MWIEEIPIWLLCLIVFGVQICFVFFRTLNVIYTAEKRTLGALLTGIAVHLSWLLTVSIGVKSVMMLDFEIIAFSLSGGLLGTYLGIMLKKRIESKQTTLESDG